MLDMERSNSYGFEGTITAKLIIKNHILYFQWNKKVKLRFEEKISLIIGG